MFRGLFDFFVMLNKCILNDEKVHLFLNQTLCYYIIKKCTYIVDTAQKRKKK